MAKNYVNLKCKKIAPKYLIAGVGIFPLMSHKLIRCRPGLSITHYLRIIRPDLSLTSPGSQMSTSPS